MTDTIIGADGLPRRKNLRDFAKERTTKKLTDAAKSLFAEVGYEGATVRAIAKRAKMSTGAFFATWDDKDHCWREIMGLPSPRDSALYRAGPELLKAVEQACHDAKVRYIAAKVGGPTMPYSEVVKLHGESNHVAMLEALIAKATTPLPFEVEDAADAG